MKCYPNADLADLCLSDGMIDLLKSGRVDNTLLCELASHLDFIRLIADFEIYVNRTAVKQVQGANAIVDAMSATIVKQHNPDISDLQKASLVFICKRLRLNYGRLRWEDKATLKRFAGKSDLLKNPIPQRGRK